MEEKDEREALIAERVREEAGDAMKELENKTLDSKMEMEILDALDEIRALNARSSQASGVVFGVVVVVVCSCCASAVPRLVEILPPHFLSVIGAE